MVETCKKRQCTPYESICYCGPKNGISVSQPKHQVKSDGCVVNNPCYDPEQKVSYWTYKFTIDGAPSSRGLSNFVIPVCNRISALHIQVEELIDGCGEFSDVPFTLAPRDCLHGTAPDGFNWLKIDVGDRYDKGVCVVYRVRIAGDFPAAAHTIRAKAGTALIKFKCRPDCFLVPICPEVPRLTVTKSCSEQIARESVRLLYTVTVANQGNETIEDVHYVDQISYDGNNVALGEIAVDPEELSSELAPGLVLISGSLGSLGPGEVFMITYSINLISFAAPGRYTFVNSAQASASVAQAVATCAVSVDVVELHIEKCCTMTEDGRGTFGVTINSVGASPVSVVSFTDELTVPSDVSVRFTSFSGCQAIFADTGSSVPLNSDVSGQTIIISCHDLVIPASGSITKEFAFKIVSTRSFTETSTMTNTLADVDFLTSDSQVLIGISPLPVSAEIDVRGTAACRKEC